MYIRVTIKIIARLGIISLLAQPSFLVVAAAICYRDCRLFIYPSLNGDGVCVVIYGVVGWLAK